MLDQESLRNSRADALIRIRSCRCRKSFASGDRAPPLHPTHLSFPLPNSFQTRTWRSRVYGKTRILSHRVSKFNLQSRNAPCLRLRKTPVSVMLLYPCQKIAVNGLYNVLSRSAAKRQRSTVLHHSRFNRSRRCPRRNPLKSNVARPSHHYKRPLFNDPLNP